jgi:hypothetical protein
MTRRRNIGKKKSYVSINYATVKNGIAPLK